ncbi:MAG: hypothetical protein ACRDQ7_18050 [Haloechinothrix sp.]
MLRSRAVPAACALMLVLAACGQDNAPPEGVSVSLQQWRSDETAHALQVAVRNESATPVHFADVQLITDSFEVLPPETIGSTLASTPRTDLRIPYGRARCTPDRVPEMRPATVVAHLRVGDGDLREVRFDLPHPEPLLSKLLVAECGAFLITQVADFGFGAEWVRAGDALRGTVRVSRRGGGERVTVHELGDTTNYTLRPLRAGEPVAVLSGGADRLDIPVQVRAARCDPHAFAEAKKGFVFPVWASVGAGETRHLTFTPPQATRSTFNNFARDVCGL